MLGDMISQDLGSLPKCHSLRTISLITFLLFLILFILNVYKLKTERLSPSGYFDFQHEKYQDPCFGHFHFCSFKEMLQDNELYGHLNFQDFYDLSPLQNFATKFYLNRPPVPRKQNVRLMSFLRNFTTQEHKNKWLSKNIPTVFLAQRNVTLVCSYHPSDYFVYHFQYLGIKKMDVTKIMITVHETRKANLSDPLIPILGLGLLSNIFGKVRTPLTASACDTLSYREGKYYIECPILESNFTIQIQATYLPPSRYRYLCKSSEVYLLKTYSSTVLKPLGLYFPKPFSQSTKKPKCSSAAVSKKYGFWMKLNGIWHWTTKQCYQSFKFDEPIRQCLKAKNILALGDSHMAGRNETLISHQIWNASFLYTTVAAELAERLDNLTRNTTPDVIVINSGHWSLYHTEISTYLSDMKNVFSVIKSLKARRPSPKIIWVNILPQSNLHMHPRWVHNVIIVALNDWVNHFMNKLGVEIIKAFDIAFPVSSHTIDGAHVFQYVENDVNTHNKTVSVGGAIASILIHTICPLL